MDKPCHLILITVRGGWLALHKWHHYRWENWDSERVPQPVTGRIQRSASRTCKINQHTQFPGSVKRPIQDCHHVSLLLVPFRTESASQGWCLISSLTLTERATHYRGGILCVPIKYWFTFHFQTSAETSMSRWQWLSIPVHSVPFQG